MSSYEVGAKPSFFDNKLTANIALYRSVYTDLPSTIQATAGTLVVLTNDVRLQGIELEVHGRPVTDLDLYFIGAG